MQVWGALENKRLFQATYLYLLARATYTKLRLETDPVRLQFIAAFPILGRQWASISHFREVLHQIH